MWAIFNEYSPFITAIAALAAVGVSIFNTFKLTKVSVSINGRMDQLLKSSGEAEFAKGEIKERDKNE